MNAKIKQIVSQIEIANKAMTNLHLLATRCRHEINTLASATGTPVDRLDRAQAFLADILAERAKTQAELARLQRSYTAAILEQLDDEARAARIRGECDCSRWVLDSCDRCVNCGKSH